MMDILLADDQRQVRSALRLLLEQKTGARIVGEATNAQTLLSMAGQVHPDTILIDWELPGQPASNGLVWLRRAYPLARILVLSSHPDTRHSALQAGADAFVCKGDPPEALLSAINALFGVAAQANSPALVR